jgi:metallo-beta-lactamase family protein
MKVNAAVHTVGGLSAHADQDGLMSWYEQIRDRPPVMLVHGEPNAMQPLTARLQTELGVKVTQPQFGESHDL